MHCVAKASYHFWGRSHNVLNFIKCSEITTPLRAVAAWGGDASNQYPYHLGCNWVRKFAVKVSLHIFCLRMPHMRCSVHTYSVKDHTKDNSGADCSCSVDGLREREKRERNYVLRRRPKWIKCLFDPPPIQCPHDKGMEVKIYSPLVDGLTLL